jgi:hypothetical protein
LKKEKEKEKGHRNILLDQENSQTKGQIQH